MSGGSAARNVIVAATAVAAMAFPAAAGAGPITKLEGSAGCVADAGADVPAGDCTRARRIDDVTDVAVSPDGKFLYAVATSSNAIAVFSRDPASGALTQLPGARGCIVWNGTAPNCGSARGLDTPSALAMSPDGKSIYVTTFKLDSAATPPKIQGTLLSFSRDPDTGALTQLGGADGCKLGGVNSPLAPVQPVTGCTQATFAAAPTRAVPLGTSSDVEVSADGESVVTSSFLGSAIVNWSRNTTTGALTPEECFSDPDSLFPQTGATGSCDATAVDTGGPADGLAYPLDVEIAPDGEHVYAAALGLEQDPQFLLGFVQVLGGTDLPGSVAVFDRDPGTGGLSQSAAPNGCVDDLRDPVPGDECTHETALLNPYRVNVSPDSQNVYVGSLNVFPPDSLGFGPGPGELAQFDAALQPLNPPCLQQLGLPAGALQPTPNCSLTAFGLILPSDVAFSPDGSSAYVSSLFHSVGSYQRAPSGELTQDAPKPGCSIDPRNLDEGTAILGQVCQNATPLNAPTSIQVSPDGQNAYVTSGGFLTGDPNFGPALADAGVTSDDSIVVFGPTPPVEPPPETPVGKCRGVDATITATAGKARGTAGDDVIVARKKRDAISGRGGNDLICAGGGNDVVSGGAGADRVFGGAGRDRLGGGADDDRLLGEGGRDNIRGGNGNDRLGGGPGRDRLAGGAGEDRCGRAKSDRRSSCENGGKRAQPVAVG